MTLALDGTPVTAGNGIFGPGGTSFPMPSGFTNLLANSAIIAAFASEGGTNGSSPQPTVTAVSDNSGQGLTWRKIASTGWIDNGPSVVNTPYNLAVWWTIAPTAFSNTIVTFTTGSSIVDDATAIVFAISGVNSSWALDGNSSLPVTTTSTTGVNPTPTISGISTNAPNGGMILVFGASSRNNNHSGWDTASKGFTSIAHSVNFQDTVNVSLGAEFKIVSTSVTNTSASFDNSAFTFQGNAYGMIATSLKAPIVWSPSASGDDVNLHITTWGSSASFNDTFTAVGRGDLVDRSIQVEGTFGSGTSVTLKGSNDGTNFHALHDPFNNVIAITSANIVQVLELTSQMQPAITAGTGAESLTITVCSRRSFR